MCYDGLLGLCERKGTVECVMMGCWVYVKGMEL